MPKTKRVEVEHWILWDGKGQRIANTKLRDSAEEVIEMATTEDISWKTLYSFGYRALPATVVVEVPDE